MLEYSEKVNQREEEYRNVRHIVEELNKDFQETKKIISKFAQSIKKKMKS